VSFRSGNRLIHTENTEGAEEGLMMGDARKAVIPGEACPRVIKSGDPESLLYVIARPWTRPKQSPKSLGAREDQYKVHRSQYKD
jgi:hypothetical protein